MNTSTKTFRNAPLLLGIASHLRRFFLALVVLGSLAATHVASAAKIELDVIMPGYGWVVVRPNSNTGGRVAWDPARYVWYTDRVSRGERLYAFVTPEAGESTTYPAKYGIWCKAKQKYLVGPRSLPWYGWCWYAEYAISTDPSDDNLVFDVYTNLGLSTKQIPIGRR